MTNIINVEKAYLEMIYRIMLKRIAKGYSPELASSIICREPGYFTAIESLQVKVSTEQELQEIAWALGEQELASFLPIIKDLTMLNVLMQDRVEGNHHIHTCDIITENHDVIPFFRIPEEIQLDSAEINPGISYLFTINPVSIYSSVN